mmetsp:Transcript_50120/g.98112  ORF Transcript_50120/g.98112 Transcript_50120/m.98112 type:complete len:119 (-) Transcript_50120:334-690(-)
MSISGYHSENSYHKIPDKSTTNESKDNISAIYNDETLYHNTSNTSEPSTTAKYAPIADDPDCVPETTSAGDVQLITDNTNETEGPTDVKIHSAIESSSTTTAPPTKNSPKSLFTATRK